MTAEKILVVSADTDLGVRLDQNILTPAGYNVTFVAEGRVAVDLLRQTAFDLIFVASQVVGGDGLEFGARLVEHLPAQPLIFIAEDLTMAMGFQALRQGFWDCIPASAQQADVLRVIQQALSRRQRLKSWAQLESRRAAANLQKRLDALESLQGVSRSVTSMLDLDAILTVVVDAAVELTGAEEGSLLLLDEHNGELTMRAARNFQDDFVQKFRLPVTDTLPGQVIRTGKAITMDQAVPQKIKTSYLVHTLIYVPMQVQNRVIGVLGVDNRQSGHPFQDEHVSLISMLADYAAIAIENTRAYESVEIERKKLETILTKVEDCVIVVDRENKLMIANHVARSAFHLRDNQVGLSVQEIIHHQDLLDIFEQPNKKPYRSEIQLDDGRIFSAQVTPILEVGIVVTMQDITHLKALDRIKSEFVSTVSHDLRSPLTAILGYVELIARVGPVTEQQLDFIGRVRVSVQNITCLINDLLDLGRIEAGIDIRKETTPFAVIVQAALDSLAGKIADNAQILTVDVPEDIPGIMGNQTRLRQMVTNLLLNAINYTPRFAKITVHAHCEVGQIIFQVTDSGPGLSAKDQPHIFDKFYRSKNVPENVTETGLGLAIVKSIAESHSGRVWVDSAEGKGSTFTVVLPIVTGTNE